jgi:hypothetical protein
MNQNEQLINITSIFVNVLSSSSESSSELLKSRRTKAWNKDTISSFLPCNRITKLRLKQFKVIPLCEDKPAKLKTSYITTTWNCSHILNTHLYALLIWSIQNDYIMRTLYPSHVSSKKFNGFWSNLFIGYLHQNQWGKFNFGLHSCTITSTLYCTQFELNQIS